MSLKVGDQPVVHQLEVQVADANIFIGDIKQIKVLTGCVRISTENGFGNTYKKVVIDFVLTPQKINQFVIDLMSQAHAPVPLNPVSINTRYIKMENGVHVKGVCEIEMQDRPSGEYCLTTIVPAFFPPASYRAIVEGNRVQLTSLPGTEEDTIELMNKCVQPLKDQAHVETANEPNTKSDAEGGIQPKECDESERPLHYVVAPDGTIQKEVPIPGVFLRYGFVQLKAPTEEENERMKAMLFATLTKIKSVLGESSRATRSLQPNIEAIKHEYRRVMAKTSAEWESRLNHMETLELSKVNAAIAQAQAQAEGKNSDHP